MTQRWPTMVHAGAGVCFHTGLMKAGLDDEGGPACAGGERIDRAWIDGRGVPIAEGWPALTAAYGWPKRAAGRQAGEP